MSNLLHQKCEALVGAAPMSDAAVHDHLAQVSGWHLKDGSIYGLVIQDPYMMGFAGVWYGYAAAHGVRLPKNVDTGVGTVTKANMSDPAFAGLLDVTKRSLGSFVGN